MDELFYQLELNLQKKEELEKTKMENENMSMSMITSKEAKEIGPELIKEAAERTKKKRGEKIIGKIEQLTNHITAVKISIEKANNELSLYESYLQAINDGNFEIIHGSIIVTVNNEKIALPF